MRTALDIITQMQELTNELDGKMAYLNKELSKLDKKMSSIYHEVELANLDKESSIKLMAKMQRVTRQRREIKMEMDNIKKVNATLRLNKEMKAKVDQAKIEADERHRENIQYAHWLKEDNTYLEA
ncbi:hypothetical protein [Priestia aryabhattai]|uniref:hypothetical protein n=1 Tax=Priestia aryabhattai TaxID=412384 RepID=UPI0015F42514|nr:hypothetical protein [Priestia aryabhattai]